MTAESSPEPEIANPVYAPLEQFRRGLRAIAEFLAVRKLCFIVGPSPQRFQFALYADEDDHREILARHELTFRDLAQVFYDLDDILAAGASGVSPDAFAARRADPDRFEDGEHEDPDIARQKFAEAETVFPFEEVRRRLWLKATSKIPVLGAFEWEVGTKTESDRGLPSGGPITYGAIRIRGESSQEPPPTAMRAGEIVLTVDSQDVDFMLDALRRLREAMTQTNDDPTP